MLTDTLKELNTLWKGEIQSYAQLDISWSNWQNSRTEKNTKAEKEIKILFDKNWE